MEGVSHGEARALLDLALTEAVRIEHKFSRYRNDNIVYQINNSAGLPVEVDDETARLLDYAEEIWKLSDGLFDITSGVLRRVWKFDGSDRIPEAEAVRQVLAHIGWQKVHWGKPRIELPNGMEIDLGGIGKEYAVDATAVLLAGRSAASYAVNFGGDLFISGPRKSGEHWTIGVDDPARPGVGNVGALRIARGGIATSGDARRFLMKDGVRYGHILNPKTGWPPTAGPHSVTVVAPTCLEAGIFSTLAMLHGADAERFLKEQDVPFWIN
jgi:thiamine biosynthesis lipoprotein